MRFDYLIASIIKTLRDDHFFDNMKIIKAYPCNVKPTRLIQTCIAVGLNEVNISPCCIDDDSKVGEISVFIDIFIPIHIDNGCASEIFCKICNLLNGYNIKSISAERAAVDAAAQAYVLKSIVTFSSEKLFGGDADEL